MIPSSKAPLRSLRPIVFERTEVTAKRFSKAPVTLAVAVRDIRALRTSRTDSSPHSRPRKRERTAPFSPPCDRTVRSRRCRSHSSFLRNLASHTLPQPIRYTHSVHFAHPSHAASTAPRSITDLAAVPARATVVRFLSIDSSQCPPEERCRPTMPTTMTPMKATRRRSAGSSNRTMPSVAVPTAPMPVQTA
ncbi:hypothetical protein SAMN05444342_0674 [Haladaptatus paucihalophilus DX253]|uniref:Uncharacterized protein n=1 Tax=Haladaptatus paucihalophilus DX253 TaxID=797209 RepID=A0A1M6PY08_HALPU|nr:hypothetical protein SAMN05444342_0674 [Haladaptatus paucihalophilus DX253]